MMVAVVYHSGQGHTRRVAEAVRDGAAELEGTEAVLLDISEAQRRWEELGRADAIVFGCPTYMGGVSAEFKTFLDLTSHAVMFSGFAWRDKVAAGFTNSGSRAGDKLATLMQIALFAAQHGMHWVNLGLPPGNNSSKGSEAELNRLGFWLGAGTQSNVDEGPESAPPESDLATARHLGRRVAAVARRLKGREVGVGEG